MKARARSGLGVTALSRPGWRIVSALLSDERVLARIMHQLSNRLAAEASFDQAMPEARDGWPPVPACLAEEELRSGVEVGRPPGSPAAVDGPRTQHHPDVTPESPGLDGWFNRRPLERRINPG